jgi:hypothetical protein
VPCGRYWPGRAWVCSISGLHRPRNTSIIHHVIEYQRNAERTKIEE